MELLQPLVGKKVTVFSLLGAGQEKQDVGVLEAAAGNFIKVRKNEHDVMFFPMDHVRMIKPFEPL